MRINEMAKAIEADLERYAKTTNEEMQRIIKREADEIAKEVREAGGYKDHTGKYRKSIAVKIESKGQTAFGATVYSKGQHQLTHLLENGHVNRDGSRSRSYPHWTKGQRMADEIPGKIQKELSK